MWRSSASDELCMFWFNRDVSRGRENIPMAVINGVDDDPVPTDFQYITENVETTNLNINRTISSLQVRVLSKAFMIMLLILLIFSSSNMYAAIWPNIMAMFYKQIHPYTVLHIVCWDQICLQKWWNQVEILISLWTRVVQEFCIYFFFNPCWLDMFLEIICSLICFPFSFVQSCRCSDDCSSMYCVCGRNSVKCWYDKVSNKDYKPEHENFGANRASIILF